VEPVVKEVGFTDSDLPVETASFVACLATILELPLASVPSLSSDEDPATGWTVSRWLGERGLGLARIADPTSFSWPGPWIARVRAPAKGHRRSVVMFGVPSGVVWDPSGGPAVANIGLEDGFVVAAADIALALPTQGVAPAAGGTVQAIYVSPSAGEPTQALRRVQALAGRGLAGDRHVVGAGTFPSGLAGSALTLIEAEVCDSFDPPLPADAHRRNVVTRGIGLNGLVGREFTIGEVPCRGRRLCEPCTVMQRYAGRPVLRALVHRGGLRADILQDGEFVVGDELLVSD
jgi:hypothetical protein